MKIAICVPHYGDVKAEFALRLANMVSRTVSTSISPGQRGPIIKAFFEGGANLIANRTNLFRAAKEWGADFILAVDADQVFPTDALIRLLRHQLPVVGCNYAQRGRPTAPVAARLAADGSYSRIWTEKADVEAGRVEPVAFLGLGFCLIHAQALGALEGSLFQPPLGDDGEVTMGEDVYFFKRLRDAGLTIHLDHALSWEIGHIWEDVRHLSDAIAERDDWWAQQRKAEALIHASSVLSASGP